MQLTQKSSSMLWALRRKADKKVRQPLQKAIIPVTDAKMGEELNYIADLIKAEVNIKELEVVNADDSSISLVKRIKPNFKTLGKKYGKQMKEIAAVINAFSQEQIAELEKNQRCELTLPSGAVEVDITDVEIATEDMPGWLVANEGLLTIALDITVTEALREEGIARELVNRIQNLRKSSGLEITDKIAIQIESLEAIDSAVEHYKSYIMTQVLGSSLEVVPALSEATELDFDDFMVKLSIQKL